MNQFGAVRVDLFTSGLRISGLNQDPDQARRLSDVLNSPDAQFAMSEVALRDLTGRASSWPATVRHFAGRSLLLG